MKVFFTGTERINQLTPEILTRIHNVMELKAEILIGNYRGFDQLALAFLSILEYPRVTVYETGSYLDFGYPIVHAGCYPAQDIAMSEQADYMLAVWDGRSYGVGKNLQRMSRDRIRLIRI